MLRRDALSRFVKFNSKFVKRKLKFIRKNAKKIFELFKLNDLHIRSKVDFVFYTFFCQKNIKKNLHFLMIYCINRLKKLKILYWNIRYKFFSDFFIKKITTNELVFLQIYNKKIANDLCNIESNFQLGCLVDIFFSNLVLKDFFVFLKPNHSEFFKKYTFVCLHKFSLEKLVIRNSV